MKLFLDIDGVMVHANPHRKVEFEDDGFYKFNRKAVDVVNRIASEGVEIILSTSHRYRYTIPKWEAIFHKRGIKFDKISILDIELTYSNTRKIEIENWIKHNKYRPEEILIIDDDKSLNGLSKNVKSRLVLTNSYIGLDNVKEVEKLLINKKAHDKKVR